MLLERGALFAGGLGVGLLARCQNSTEMNLGAAPAAGGGATVAQAGEVVTPTTQAATSAGAAPATTAAPEPVPLGPGGIPLARRDRAVRLPIYDGNAAIASGLAPEKGPLKLYNYSDYIDPAVVARFEERHGVKVQISTFQSMDEAIAKLTTGRFDFDVMFPTVDRIPTLVAQRLAAPLNHDYVPHLAENIWPEFLDPYYDAGAQYTVPYTLYGTGIAWRNDVVDLDVPNLANPWDALWQGRPWKGKVAVIDDARDALALPLLRAGVEDLNTEDPALIAQALADLEELSDEVAVKVAYSIYQDVPEGKLQLSQAWSGDILAGALFYRPKGVALGDLSYWLPATAGPIANDTMCVLASGKHPVLAHLFLDFMLETRSAYDNFVNYNGYQPPQISLDPGTLQERLGLPASLAPVVIGREQWAEGRSLLSLTPTGEAAWQSAWSKFKAG